MREIANDRGSTPLHKAASIGRLDLVRWLLEHGAEVSLSVRTRRGNTPLQISRLYGPFPQVEAELLDAMRRRGAGQYPSTVPHSRYL